ncbi:hypothetical protein JCM11641_001289 [Rhodosporidiobolus odoratus]
MQRRDKEDIVWALHTFEAENEDELAFEAGEVIAVLERDDQFGDGWFQGRNQRGEIGLFPQSYTSDRPPSFYPFEASALTSTVEEGAADAAQAAGPSSHFTVDGYSSTSGNGQANGANDGQSLAAPSSRAAPSINISHSPVASIASRSRRRLSLSGASVHSRASELTRDYDLDDDETSSLHEGARRPEDGVAHRAALAAKAMENAEKAARQEREKAERRRKDDEERYERTREGLIEGLQLSDESESEDEGHEADQREPFSALRARGQTKAAEGAKEAAKEVVADGGEAAPTVSVSPAPLTGGGASLRPPLHDAFSSSSSLGAAQEQHELRPRADTQPSVYAESIYSTTSSAAPPLPSPAAIVASQPPSPAKSVVAPLPTSSSTESSSVAAPVADALEGLRSAASTTTAALAGVATAAAAGVGLAVSDRQPSPEPAVRASEPDLAKPAMHAALPKDEAEQTALPVDIAAAERAPSPIHSVYSQPKPRTPSPHPPPAPIHTATPVTAVAPSLTASPASLAFGTSTAATSAPPSETGKEGGLARDIPVDPLTWSVEDVVTWAKSKGFDKMTVGKFEGAPTVFPRLSGFCSRDGSLTIAVLPLRTEHEISGDVLLEMDVAMLKEIDLIAFGRRVHIYNAIKELKARTHPELMAPPPSASRTNLGSSTSTGPSFLSPAMSGYEPDSPGSLGMSPAQYQSPQMRWEQGRPEKLAGLGLEEDSQGSLRAPSSLGQPSIPNLRSGRAHERSTTGTTFDSYDPPTSASSVGGTSLPPPLPAPVPPKRRTAEPTTGDESTTDANQPRREKKFSTRPNTASSLRPGKSAKKGKDVKSDTGGETATSTPSSPNPSSGRKGSKSDTGTKSFFGASLPGLPGRSRKPPPRVPSALLLDTDGAVPRPRPRSALQDRAKRSTRLFGAFGTTSGSEKSPTAVDSVRSRASNSTLGGSREAPTTMRPKEVDPATKEMLREKAEAVKDGNLMDKIGRPDHSGWMRKKGDKYNTWKMRFFVLKGVYLYYLKSEQERKAKGVIDLTGYRVLSDPNIRPGEFGFKIVHDRGKAHFFAAAEQITVRNWMKEIMKATILRDYSGGFEAPVVSSCDIEVLPLDVAKTMTPYPRPPSPTRRAQIQKERYAGTNPNQLTQKDAAILMDFAPGSPLMNGEALWTSASTPRPAKAERQASATSIARSATSETPTDPAVLGDLTPKLNGTSPSVTRLVRATSDTSRGELLAWLNSNLPSSCPLATDLSHSLSSGRLLVRLLENLSGNGSGIEDAQFAGFHQDEGLPFDTSYLDTIFSVFDYISPQVSTDDLSMEDMITGNETRLTLLVERIRATFPNPADIHTE